MAGALGTIIGLPAFVCAQSAGYGGFDEIPYYESDGRWDSEESWIHGAWRDEEMWDDPGWHGGDRWYSGWEDDAFGVSGGWTEDDLAGDDWAGDGYVGGEGWAENDLAGDDWGDAYGWSEDRLDDCGFDWL